MQDLQKQVEQKLTLTELRVKSFVTLMQLNGHSIQGGTGANQAPDILTDPNISLWNANMDFCQGDTPTSAMT